MVGRRAEFSIHCASHRGVRFVPAPLGCPAVQRCWNAAIVVLVLALSSCLAVETQAASAARDLSRQRQDEQAQERQDKQEQRQDRQQEQEQTQERADSTKQQEVREQEADRVPPTGGAATEGMDDSQLFFNPKYDDAALPVRSEEEWTPPTPIDWSVEGVMELNFDHLKFNIRPDETFEVRQLTLDLLKLRGRTIRIRGYIRPSFREKNITRFVFVRDNQECCFGPGAALYDCMIVNMAPNHSVNFSTRPVTLEGRFELKPFRGPDRRVWAIFELNDTVLK